MTRPLIRFRVDFGDHASIGPGKIDLLEAIDTCGSLTKAARNRGLSYRRAWLLIDSLKQCFREPVTRASTGGKGGGGVVLTDFGRLMVDRYRSLEREIAGLAERHLQMLSVAVVPTAPAAPAKRGAKAKAAKTAASRRPMSRRIPIG